ncbi:MAG: formyltransferase family protein [Patescibacteria group bacterium]
MPKILVFASGTASGGGSGFENLVRHSRDPQGDLKAEIVGVVSNHQNGGVRLRAEALHVPFFHFPEPHDAEHYRELAARSGAEWFALSGWLKMIHGLDPARTFNVHPALLSALGGRFGGANMYGRKVHEAVKAALETGEITGSGVSMHFVTDEYDRGPVFFEHPMPLRPGMSAEEIQEKVYGIERVWQPKITNLIVNGDISWDGKDPSTLKVPEGYTFLPKRNS